MSHELLPADASVSQTIQEIRMILHTHKPIANLTERLLCAAALAAA
jgi:hypothetical protein